MGGALAAGGALLAPRVSRALAAEPRGDVFEMPLRGAGPQEAPRAFDLVGLEWDAPADARVALRVRRSDGPWSPWLSAPTGHGHGPDRASGRQLSDPVWTGDAHVIEVRTSRRLHGARLHFVKAHVGPAHSAAKRLATPELAAGPGQPPIIARSSWATRACRPRRAPYYGVMEVAFVHHTAGLNYYRAGQSAAIVRAICLFHRNVHGWNDIGYNFLVDRYGQIFEGREGGIDEALAGAQAGGYNLSSTGVAMIGTYSSVAPTPRALDALSRLLAWKLSLHGIDAGGRTTVEVSRYGSEYSRYRAGTPVHLHRIAGHRDGDATTCPGYVLYARLPRLRGRVAALQGPLSALAVEAISGANLSGHLTSDGQPVAGAQVEIQRRGRAGEETLVSVTTGPDGAWSASAPLSRNATLRALYRGARGISAVVSPAAFAAVPTQVTLQVTSQQAAVGIPVVFSGTVSPAKEYVTLVVSQLQPDGTYAQVRTIRVAVDSTGSFSRGVAFSSPGQYQVVAETARDATNAAGASPPVAMTVV